MKFLINKSEFENMLSNLQPFLEKKDVSQITSHILIDVNDEKIILKATDYEIGLESVSESCLVESSGKATANGKKLLEIIKRLKNDDILIESDENNIKIKQAKSNFKLPMFNPDEYPSFPNTDINEKIEINNLELLRAIKKSIPAIDSNNPKYELNGALIDIKENQINIAATDTKRLSIVKIDNNTNIQKEIIVHKKALIEIQKIFSSDIEIMTDETNLIIKSKHDTFFTKLINGKFPNYERIVPQDTKHKIELPKREITEAIKIVTSISNEIKITLEESKMILESLSDENSEAKTELEFNMNLEEKISFGVNSKYLTDFLSIIDSDTFTIELTKKDTPFIIKSENFQTIIMPIAI